MVHCAALGSPYRADLLSGADRPGAHAHTDTVRASFHQRLRLESFARVSTGVRDPLSVVDDNQKVVGALSVVGATKMSKLHKICRNFYLLLEEVHELRRGLLLELCGNLPRRASPFLSPSASSI